jgi:hypothetical protein
MADDAPYLYLAESDAYPGVLNLRAARDLPPNTLMPTAANLFSEGKISQISANGYIRLPIFDEIFTKTAIATAEIHIEAILKFCGEESVSSLTEGHMIGVNAFLASGADPNAARTGGLKEFLHKSITPLAGTLNLPGKTEDQLYFIEKLTPTGPVWKVSG